MLASVGIAAAGWFLARTWHRDERATAARLEAWKLRYAGWHRVLYNKYYVDEIYQATFVRGFMALSRACAWFDRTVVDGVVNATAPFLKGVAALSGWIDQIFVDGAVN